MGHKTVKAAVKAALAARLPGYGQAAAYVDVGDDIPEDNSRWPLVLVRTTRMGTARHTGGRQLRCTYRVRVTVGVRSEAGEIGLAAAQATDSRDDLLEAVRDALLHTPGLGSGVRLSPAGIVEDTEPAIPTRQGPREAFGQIAVDVTAVETVRRPSTAPPDPVITDVDVEIQPHPADHTLF